ncbi:MAG TPA: DUF4292 domain-containing protein [Pseudomonadota bacterium]|nr:DUF4292 domain-containing protein [Pseudomonadota bacterium]
MNQALDPTARARKNETPLRRPAIHLAFCFGMTVALTGCPPPPVVIRPYPAPNAAELLSDVRKSQAKVQSMKLYAKADVPDDGGGRVKLDVSIAVKRPAQLRLTAESTLTGPLLTLATDGQRFQLLDAQNNRYLSSVVTPCSMARLLRVALPPSILADVLSGGVPLLPPDSLTVQSDWDEKEGGREVIKLRDPEGRRQVLYLQPSEPGQAQSRSFDVVESELSDRDGKPFLRIRHQKFAPVQTDPMPADPVRLPKQSTIEDLTSHTEVKLRWKETEVNPALDATLFYLPQPVGIPTDPDPCVPAAAAKSP